MKTKAWIILIVLALIQISAVAVMADTYTDWMEQGGDPEQTASNIFKKLVDYVLLGVACVGALSISVGLFQWTGKLFSQDREKGASRIKSGFIGMVGAGVFYIVISVAVNLARG